MADETTQHVNLFDFVAFLLRWRRFLLTLVLTVAIAVTVISFLVKPKYRSTAVIRGTERSEEGFGGLIASKLAAFSGITGMGSAGGATPGEMFVQILKSRWMSERLIEKFDLRTVYGMKDQVIEEVIKAALSNTRYELDPMSESVLVYAEDHDPKRSQAMTQFLVDELDTRNQELKSLNAKREREFIGQRLEEAQTYLTKLEDSLAEFQQQTGVLNVQEQLKATISAAAQIEAERLSLQTQLEMNESIFGPGNPEITYLQMKVASLDSSLKGLHQARDKGNESDMLMHLADTPREGLTYLRLMRDIEIQQLLTGFLIQKFEQARIEEQRNTPTLMRLDPPMVATQRIWPRRGLMVSISAFAVFVFGIAIALLTEVVQRATADPQHPNHVRLRMIRESWSRKRS